MRRPPHCRTHISATPVIDSSNAATGISVAVNVTYNTGNGTGSGWGGAGINGPAGADPFDESNAITDGIFANKNTVGTSTITFTGLANSTKYDISAIGGRASNGLDGIISVIQGTSSFSTYSLLNDGTIQNFSVTSTSGGVIQFGSSRNELGSPPSTLSATFNAMSITAVPEPASLALGGARRAGDRWMAGASAIALA